MGTNKIDVVMLLLATDSEHKQFSVGVNGMLLFEIDLDGYRLAVDVRMQNLACLLTWQLAKVGEQLKISW